MSIFTVVTLVCAVATLSIGVIVFHRRYRDSQNDAEPDHQARLLSLTMTSAAALFALITVFYATGVM
ncbi:hypothetical protein GCM10009720_09050 [Yaniella flava]|uniref:Uncharacterized protein n=1 Tax=Yaniella flava TaxID=287930 RepID=A0ABP5FPP8_9MICC